MKNHRKSIPAADCHRRRKAHLFAAGILIAMVQSVILVPATMAFSTSDLDGVWSMYWMETASPDGVKYWIEGAIGISSSGSITGGNWTAASGTTGTITGGSLAISARGELSGLVKLSTGTASEISGGWMDASKTIAYVVTTKDTVYLAAGILIKQTTGFLTSQLAGQWNGFMTEALGVNAGWQYADLDVETDGGYTGRVYSAVSSNNVTTSKFYMDTSGMMTGTYVTSLSGVSDKGSIPSGRMDQSRQIACVDYRKNSGKLGTMIMINGDQSGYTTANLQGDWALYITEMLPGESDTYMYWIKGNIKLSASGQLISGSWESYGETQGTFTAGNVAVQFDGRLSGTLETSDGKIMRIDYGQLSRSKTYGACLLQKGDSMQLLDTLDYVFMIRKPSQPAGISNLMLLLLNEE